MNLTFRTLAAVLKYDQVIPSKRKGGNLAKGYYSSEKELVKKIKKSVVGNNFTKPLKSVECHIMDVADDIAYSTYDIEDALKAEFLTPLDFISPKSDLVERICSELNKNANLSLNEKSVKAVLLETFKEILEPVYELVKNSRNGKLDPARVVGTLSNIVAASKDLATNGYLRTQFTSSLVQNVINGIKFQYNKKYPALSKVYLEKNTLERVEVLKRFAYVSLIKSPRLKISETRGQQIVEDIFKNLAMNDGGHELLPHDFRVWYERSKAKVNKMRVICDFIAGMTDRYAVEFYSRLHSENPATIFKPY